MLLLSERLLSRILPGDFVGHFRWGLIVVLCHETSVVGVVLCTCAAGALSWRVVSAVADLLRVGAPSGSLWLCGGTSGLHGYVSLFQRRGKWALGGPCTCRRVARRGGQEAGDFRGSFVGGLRLRLLQQLLVH